MRRLAVPLVLVAIAAIAIAVVGVRGASSSTVRFDVIFDDARGLVGGQVVKIAGARAGTIQNVVLTRGFKARIEASVDRRFMPFHQDATCTIRPEALVAENYVECDPGSVGSPLLRGSGGHPPTVPVTHTTEPVNLLDLFNIFNVPTRERLTVLLNELGIATAARGGDINQILLRANPTLALARQAISILQRQRYQLQTVIDALGTISAEGAAHTATLQRFLDRTAALSSLVANHRGTLAQTIARLPALLAATQPALQQLDTVAVQGTPLVRQLDASVPALERVSKDLGPFAAAAKPGLRALAAALRIAVPAIRQSTPLLHTILAYARRSLGSTELAGALYPNLQQHGYSEEFLSVMYYVGTSLARFDATSHILPLLLVAPNNGQCGNYATTPVPGCSAHYGQQPSYTPQHYHALQGLSEYLLK